MSIDIKIILKIEEKENLHSCFFNTFTRLRVSHQAFIENCTFKENVQPLITPKIHTLSKIATFLLLCLLLYFYV